MEAFERRIGITEERRIMKGDIREFLNGIHGNRRRIIRMVRAEESAAQRSMRNVKEFIHFETTSRRGFPAIDNELLLFYSCVATECTTALRFYIEALEQFFTFLNETGDRELYSSMTEGLPCSLRRHCLVRDVESAAARFRRAVQKERATRLIAYRIARS